MAATGTRNIESRKGFKPPALPRICGTSRWPTYPKRSTSPTTYYPAYILRLVPAMRVPSANLSNPAALSKGPANFFCKGSISWIRPRGGDSDFPEGSRSGEGRQVGRIQLKMLGLAPEFRVCLPGFWETLTAGFLTASRETLRTCSAP